jgi:hypothetical protein
LPHAFSTLSGPGSVAEALEVLSAPTPQSHPVALSFQVTEARGAPSVANRVTITAVERDGSEIHVNYVVVPPPDIGSHQARGEAKDDLGNDYHDAGSYFGITGGVDSAQRAGTRAQGRLKLPLPPPAATVLRIRIRWEARLIRMPWEASLSSIWDGPAHEIRVSLPD